MRPNIIAIRNKVLTAADVSLILRAHQPNEAFGLNEQNSPINQEQYAICQPNIWGGMVIRLLMGPAYNPRELPKFMTLRVLRRTPEIHWIAV